jgi:hypothetical protein
LITYRVRLDVPRELVWFVSRLLARHRKETGTRKGTRCLGCYRQALFVLAWYRDKADIPRLGAGSGLSQATSYRYVAEGTTVIAAEAPGLEEALERAVREGTPYVILDGKIVSAGRCHVKTVSRKGRDIDLWYSGKKKDFGGNIQGLFYPGGLPMWISDVLPGNVHDLAAARESVLPVLRNYTGKMRRRGSAVRPAHRAAVDQPLRSCRSGARVRFCRLLDGPVRAAGGHGPRPAR